METTANSTAQHITDAPTPSQKGTFSILEDGTLMGRPESSAITMWVYLTVGILALTYKGGKTYHYRAVPFTVIAQMLTADSVGAFVNAVVKPNYEFYPVG